MNAPKTSASPKTGRGAGLRERAAGTKAKAEKVILRQPQGSPDPRIHPVAVDTLLIRDTRDLTSIEAAQDAALTEAYEDAYDCPAWVALEERREVLFARIIATRARSMSELKAKAVLMQLNGVKHHQQPIEQLAESLVADIAEMDAGPVAGSPPRGGDPQQAVDPIFAAIERHRAARERFEATVAPTDRIAVLQSGGDASPASMARAHAISKEALAAERREWSRLFATHPSTPAGLLALIRVAQEHGEADDGREVAPDVLATIAEHLQRLAGDLIPPKRDFSGFSIEELSFSLQALGRVADLLGLLTFWSSLGKAGIGLMSDQLDRIDRLRAEIREELLIRKPSRVGEADDRAAALIHDALEGRDWTEVAVMAVRTADEVADLWRRT
ncbi:MAG: hypothetical protein K2X71_06320 [Methylobacterium sp.]|uniref:hypothetical protein n=1 Tax=Methylobacterium sp. TaxID=409 RepID=UPI00259063FE|nr:hypothetical protein [Methylobacterium sp.]MBY0295640.1 hypothetical protein [Methylobacterium sp.]